MMVDGPHQSSGLLSENTLAYASAHEGSKVAIATTRGGAAVSCR